MYRSDVTLVIPGYNAAKTIRACLEAVVPLLNRDLVHEIIFVNDGSTDDTARIAEGYPVRQLKGKRQGPGAARNLGWCAAKTPLVWFIDADCVAEPDALERLLPHLDAPDFAGVGGSYGNMRENSLLACLIHEEIVQRHLGMPHEVNFLASFNVLYRREFLEKVGGFDERFLKAQDAELAYRVRRAGGRLAFEITSRVKHFHPHRLLGYLRTQRQQGYWRAWLYFAHPVKMGGDSYSGPMDHLQPVLAVVSLALLPLSIWPAFALMEIATLLGLAAAQIPMTARILARTREPKYALFAGMSFVRAYPRGLGLSQGTLSALLNRCALRVIGIEGLRKTER